MPRFICADDTASLAINAANAEEARAEFMLRCCDCPQGEVTVTEAGGRPRFRFASDLNAATAREAVQIIDDGHEADEDNGHEVRFGALMAAAERNWPRAELREAGRFACPRTGLLVLRIEDEAWETKLVWEA
jgi:hypothetical protein